MVFSISFIRDLSEFQCNHFAEFDLLPEQNYRESEIINLRSERPASVLAELKQWLEEHLYTVETLWPTPG